MLTQASRLSTVEKPRQNPDKIITRISKNFAHLVLATNLKWINAGKVIAIGDPSKAPKNPKNLSISAAKSIERAPAKKTTKNREILAP